MSADERSRKPPENLRGLARSGDRRAFDDVISCHRPHICNYLRQFALQDADIENVAQETLDKAFTKRRRIPEDEFRTIAWLFTIAKNSAFDYLRRLRRQRRRDEGHRQIVKDRESHQLTESEKDEVADRAEEILRRAESINPKFGRALRDRFWREETVDVVVKRYGLGRRSYDRELAKLKKRFQQREED